MNLGAKILAASSLSIAIAGSGVAVGAATTGTTVIHACAAKSGGALRLAGHCRSTERAVSWNARGPAGAPGLARAYAYVIGSDTSPTLDPKRTKGFTRVTEPSVGDYCLTAPGPFTRDGRPDGVGRLQQR